MKPDLMQVDIYIYIFGCLVHQHGSKVTFKWISRCCLVISTMLQQVCLLFKGSLGKATSHHLRLLDLRRGWENPQMVVICKGIPSQIAHLVPLIPCWMKWHKWNVDSIYPNFKGKFQVDIMSFSSYLEMKYSIFFEWAIFKTLDKVTFHYRIYAQLDGFFIPGLYNIPIPTDLGRNHQRKVIPRVILPNQTVGFLMSIFGKWNERIICKLFLFAYYKPSNVCWLCEFF